MSPIETAAFGTLWVVLFVLAGLVLLLYRQLEKAYAHSTGLENVGLPPGAIIPDIEVMTSDGVGPLEFPEPHELTLLAFLTASCEACSKLVGVLEEDDVFPGRVTALVSGEHRGEFDVPEDRRLTMLWLAHPPDASHSYGVTLTPHVFVLRGRTVLASKSVQSRAGLQKLLQSAQEYEQAAPAAAPVELATAPDGTASGV